MCTEHAHPPKFGPRSTCFIEPRQHPQDAHNSGIRTVRHIQTSLSPTYLITNTEAPSFPSPRNGATSKSSAIERVFDLFSTCFRPHICLPLAIYLHSGARRSLPLIPRIAQHIDYKPGHPTSYLRYEPHCRHHPSLSRHRYTALPLPPYKQRCVQKATTLHGGYLLVPTHIFERGVLLDIYPGLRMVFALTY